MRSYIGATGFTRIQEVAWMTEALDGAYGMFGVLTTPDIIAGKAPHKGRYARLEDLPLLFGSMPAKSLRCLHYCPRGDFTILTEGELEAALKAVGPDCNAVQINTKDWPSRDIVYRLRSHQLNGVLYNKTLIFQLSPRMITTPEETVSRLDPYSEDADYVIIDQSAGSGRQIDKVTARRIAGLIRTLDLDVGVVFAGGLSAETLPMISDLVHEFDASIDAESKLLADDDKLCYESLREYVDVAKKIKKGE